MFLPCLGVRARLPTHSFHRGWSRKGACGHPLLGAQQGSKALHNLLNSGPHSKVPSCPKGSMDTIWRLCSHTQNNSKASPHHSCRSIPTTSTGARPGCSHPAPQFLSNANSCSAMQERTRGTTGFKLAPGDTSQPVNLPVNRVPEGRTLKISSTWHPRAAQPPVGTSNLSEEHPGEGRGAFPCVLHLQITSL